MGLTKLDKYIIKQFVKNFLFALVCFIIIFILVDLFESLDKFIDNKFSFYKVIEFYYYFTPEIVKLITPVAMLLATLFTVGRLISFNEIITIKNAGISLMRFMLPFMIIGIIVTILSIYFNVWIVPAANKHKFSTERIYFGRHQSFEGLSKLYFQDTKDQFVMIETFDKHNMTGINVSILMYDNDTLTNLKKRLDAKSMTWENNNWVFHDAVIRDMRLENNNISYYPQYEENSFTDFNKLVINPESLLKKQLKPDELDYGELKDYIELQKQAGQDIVRAEVDFYSKISFPFSSIIVIIFGISLSTGSKRRKGLAMQFGISILVSFIYLGFVKFSQAFGYNGDIHPMLTAWLANIFFAAFGIINLAIKNY